MSDRWRQARDEARAESERLDVAEFEAARFAAGREAARTQEEARLMPVVRQLHEIHSALDRAGWPGAKWLRHGLFRGAWFIVVYVPELGVQEQSSEPAQGGGGIPYVFFEFKSAGDRVERELIAVSGTGAGPEGRRDHAVGGVRFRTTPPGLTADITLRAVAAWTIENGFELDL